MFVFSEVLGIPFAVNALLMGEQCNTILNPPYTTLNAKRIVKKPRVENHS